MSMRCNNFCGFSLQKEIMSQLSATGTPQATTSGEPTLKLFLGSFLKPYFRDKVTFLVGMSSDSVQYEHGQGVIPT